MNIKKNDALASIYRLLKRLYIRYIYGLKHVHPTFNIGGKVSLSKDLTAEEYSFVGKNSIIYPGVHIGRYTMLAHNVQIIGGDHNYNIPGVPTTFSGRSKLLKTNIGRDVWLGANVIVITGIQIGDGTIVAAGSIVTKNLPPFVIAAGIPAQVIKKRFNSIEDEKVHLQMLNGSVLKNVRNKPIYLED